MARTSARKTYAKEAVEASTIVLVDNDLSVLRALSRLIEIAGYRVIAFDRPNALLASAIPKTQCVRSH
jgi:FixJ family two-component response regulator